VAEERDFATRAVLLDALGTLLELEPPWVHLREFVPDRIDDETLIRAVRAEMAYYRAHAHEGRDQASLADLRRRCAELISRELGSEISVEQLLSSVVFAAYPDASPALADLREQRLKLIVVSNWDVSLETVLERCGLASLLDDVVSSAAAGVAKPDPAIFEVALELADCEPGEALHVGDTPEEDIEGARAAGIRALLIDRDGRRRARTRSRGAAVDSHIASLSEISEHL
jgi:putative hydrolase of the HAD superfamily